MDDGLKTPNLPEVVLGERTCLQIPSRPEWISPTVDFLKEKANLCGACHEARATKLVVALHEAITNAVVHGNLEISSELKERDDSAFAEALAERAGNPRFSSRPVTIEIDYDGERCEWAITDQGQGFDFNRHLNKEEPDEADLWLFSGRGILLMRTLVDQLRYELSGRRAILTLWHTSGVEKRQLPRMSLHRGVEVVPVRSDGSVDWEAAVNAVTQNVSGEGIGLVLSRLADTQRIILGIEIEGKPLYVPAEIRHVRSVSEGLVELGCQFLSIPVSPGQDKLPEEEREVEGAVERLLEGREPLAPGSERRVHERVTYAVRIEVWNPAGGSPLVCFSRDLSKGGISFISTTAIPQEVRLITLPQGTDSLRVRAQIVRCTELTHGFFDIGARFLSIES